MDLLRNVPTGAQSIAEPVRLVGPVDALALNATQRGFYGNSRPWRLLIMQNK